MGLPHSEPVISAKNVNAAPMGAVAFAINCATRCPQINAAALESAIAE